MWGPAILIDCLARRTVPDSYGNAWQYHSRSDKHSKVACWGIAFDLLTSSALLRRHVAEGKVVLGINHQMRDFGTGRAKKLDLVIARPGGLREPRSLASLMRRYDIRPTAEAQRALADLPEFPIARVGAVLVALEAKAVMTAHIRALPRLYDELNSSHLCIHGASRQALGIGFIMVNSSPLFVSSDRNKLDLDTRAPVISEEPQPKSLHRTLDKVAEIPRRSNVRENGFDGMGVVVLKGVNDGSRYTLVDAPPAPQPGDAFHYDGMIMRMAHEYDTTFDRI
jgi:hypothetical protein